MAQKRGALRAQDQQQPARTAEGRQLCRKGASRPGPFYVRDGQRGCAFVSGFLSPQLNSEGGGRDDGAEAVRFLSGRAGAVRLKRPSMGMALTPGQVRCNSKIKTAIQFLSLQRHAGVQSNWARSGARNSNEIAGHALVQAKTRHALVQAKRKCWARSGAVLTKERCSEDAKEGTLTARQCEAQLEGRRDRGKASGNRG
jgi:hypothetical protein